MLFALALVACAPAASKQEAAPAPPVVTLTSKTGAMLKVSVELADTPAARTQGLMFRQKLEDMSGMLFVFPREERQSFWMKNTYIPLDMIFIRSDLSIAGIVENAEPMTLTPRSVDTPSLYVLEVVGGFAAQHGIAAGNRVSFENVPPAKQ